VKENIALFESAAEAKKIELIRPDPQIVLVYADRDMTNTVIRNLLSNAIKFTHHEGTVTINIAHAEKNKIVVNVSDTGDGMNQKTIKGLFRIENRVTTKGTNNETGTGLGLILARDFIQKNNGRIWVTSEEGKGSTFWFSLPVRKK